MPNGLLNAGFPFLGGRSNALNLSGAEFRALTITSQIRQVFRGVYVDAAAEDTRELRAQALNLVKPEEAVFYGATVAFLLGVDAFPPKDRFNFAPQCIVPHHHARCVRPFVVCHEGYLPDEDLQEVEGLVVTTPLRSTVDMLRSMWRPYALGAADAMAHAGLVDRDEVVGYVRTMKRYPGIIQARALSALVEPLAESPGESWMRLRIVDAGLPVPSAQVEVRDRLGRFVARLDNGYRASKVGMEFDGREWHDDEAAVEADDEKRGYLQDSLGWRLAVARRQHIFGDDAAFENQIGEWLGITPRPRSW